MAIVIMKMKTVSPTTIMEMMDEITYNFMAVLLERVHYQLSTNEKPNQPMSTAKKVLFIGIDILALGIVVQTWTFCNRLHSNVDITLI